MPDCCKNIPILIRCVFYSVWRCLCCCRWWWWWWWWWTTMSGQHLHICNDCLFFLLITTSIFRCWMVNHLSAICDGAYNVIRLNIASVFFTLPRSLIYCLSWIRIFTILFFLSLESLNFSSFSLFQCLLRLICYVLLLNLGAVAHLNHWNFYNSAK